MVNLERKFQLRLKWYKRLTESDKYFNHPVTVKLLRWLDITARLKGYELNL